MHLSVRNNEIVKAIFEDDQSEVTVDVMADLKAFDDIFQTITMPKHDLHTEWK
jgi:hypothetical protein